MLCMRGVRCFLISMARLRSVPRHWEFWHTHCLSLWNEHNNEHYGERGGDPRSEEEFACLRAG
jgi:hypothetical protein